MLDIFNIGENVPFTWSHLLNLADGRKNLGENMPVQMYRLFQYTIKDVLLKSFGKDKTIEIFRSAGEMAGKEFALNMLDTGLQLNEFLAHLQNVLEQNKIGILRIEKFDIETGEALLTISEDLDCSGLPVTGETVCNYDEGFLRGILTIYTKREYIVTEIDCWATGSRVCRFEAKIKQTDNKYHE